VVRQQDLLGLAKPRQPRLPLALLTQTKSPLITSKLYNIFEHVSCRIWPKQWQFNALYLTVLISWILWPWENSSRDLLGTIFLSNKIVCGIMCDFVLSNSSALVRGHVLMNSTVLTWKCCLWSHNKFLPFSKLFKIRFVVLRIVEDYFYWRCL
jgi:hypothetical protein